MTCTWNPSDIASNITLSNGDLTFTSTTADFTSGRATLGYVGGSGGSGSSYLLYFEGTAADPLFSGMGISNPLETTATNFCGATSFGCGYYSNGHVAIQNALVTTLATFTFGAIIGFAVDFLHKKMWVTLDGSTWNNDTITNQNPATNTGGIDIGAWGSGGGVFGDPTNGWATVYPALGSLASGNSMTANFAGPFTYTLPAGFSGWDAPAPGSITATGIAAADGVGTASLSIVDGLAPSGIAAADGVGAATLTIVGGLPACNWNPVDVASNITLSNGNLTFTSTSTANTSGRATLGYLGGSGSSSSTNLLYFEGTAVDALFVGMGISNPVEANTNFLGETSHGCGYYSNGHVAIQGTLVTTLATFTNGAIVGYAIDFSNKKMWVTLDGSTWNNDILANQNPATNTGGIDIGAFGTGGGVFGDPTNGWATVYPGLGTLSDVGNSMTANFAGPFAYTPPTGYIAWDSEPTQTLAATGIAAVDGVGSPELSFSATLTPEGIAAADGVGAATLTGIAEMVATGIPADDGVGIPTLFGGLSATGIPADDGVGTATLTNSGTAPVGFFHGVF